jgi:hypothetical protein
MAKYQPKLLERWAYGKLQELNKKTLDIKVTYHIFILLAFLVGFFFSIPLVLIDMNYSGHIDWFSSLWFEKWSYILLASILGSIIEIYLVFRISIYLVYSMTKSYGYDIEKLSKSYILGYDFLLSRLVVGVEEPTMSIDGIDAYKRQNIILRFLKKLLFKIRITLSNAVTKLLIRRLFIQNGIRVNVAWVSAFVIGFWNAMSVFLIYKKVKKLLDNMKRVDKYLENLDTYSKDEIEIFFRIVGNVFVLSGHNLPIMQYLYFELKENYPIENYGDDIDEIEDLKKVLKKVSKSRLLEYQEFYRFCTVISELKGKKIDRFESEVFAI